MIEIEAPESSWQRWAARLLPALTFLIGLALGAVVVLSASPDGTVVAGDDPSASASPTPSTETNGDTVVTLPGACEDAAENITEATRLLDDVISAVRDFQPQELVDLLNELEDIDAATRPLAEECSQVNVSESPLPTEEPSESSE